MVERSLQLGHGKRELRSLLSRFLPYINGRKREIALFTVVLKLGLSQGAFDASHITSSLLRGADFDRDGCGDGDGNCKTLVPFAVEYQ